MRTMLIHGSYDGENTFKLDYIEGSQASVNEFNLAMQALRLRGVVKVEKYLEVTPLYQYFTSMASNGNEIVKSNTNWNAKVQ